MDIPETKYARSPDGTFIAYSEVGEGPLDLVAVWGYTTHLEVGWDHPTPAAALTALAGMGRLIQFDKRGCGLSDRTSPLTDLDTRAQDLLAVMDTAGSERAVLIGEHEGGALAAFVAATYPERVHGLVWWGGSARNAWSPDYPWGYTVEQHESDVAGIEEGWGTVDYARRFMEADGSPTLAADASFVEVLAKWMRYSASPAEAMRFDQMWWETDVRSVLPSIQVPTVVIASDFTAERATATVEAIAGAELRVVPAKSNTAWADNPHFLTVVEEFTDRVREEQAAFDRVLATVLFTDIVDSTATAATMGDAKWKKLIEEHDRLARGTVARFRGTFVRGTGDGMLATFDGPARGVRCAQAFVEAVESLGVEARAGLHTGEIEYGGNDLAGVGVHIGARVGAMAGPSEVWASSTVKDLVAGSGLVFEDAGEHELKGVPDRWHLYKVVA